jgi:hypothetical protein
VTSLTPLRFIAIGVIYAIATLAWFTLGSSLVYRTGEHDNRLANEVALLWGGRHAQRAPSVWIERERTTIETQRETDASGRVSSVQVPKTVVDRIPLLLSSSRVEVDLSLDQRRKGLLWYDTYSVGFRGDYKAAVTSAGDETVVVEFPFPSPAALYDGFVFTVNGKASEPVSELSKGVAIRTVARPGEPLDIAVAYRSRGLGDWTYIFSTQGVSQVRDFALVMRTDFADIDYPPGSMSPTTMSNDGGRWTLNWAFSSLVTGQVIGMDLPDRLNPGPLAARITFFAPVGLLFFLTVLVVIGVLQGRNLHPMNYAFLSAAFFAFHLLLAYLVDHINIHAAFAIASAVSITLVVSYLHVAAGAHFALAKAGLAQLVYLVLFSYAFFFDGLAGLTVTIGATATLFVLMQATARVDWNAVFAGVAERAARR